MDKLERYSINYTLFSQNRYSQGYPMKYKWSNHIMTRNSGCLTIYCEDEEQATENVKKFREAKLSDNKTICFLSRSGAANVIILDEVIAVSCCDIEMMFDVHREEMIMNVGLQKEVNLLIDNEES